MQGTITKVSGPLIVAENMADVKMYDVVRVSKLRLIGEVIELRNDKASIQVYEETTGLGVGEPVESTGSPLSVELAPGLIESIFDGIQRPLTVIREKVGDRITRGVEVAALDHEKKWYFEPTAKLGQQVGPGDFLGKVQETMVVEHRIMVPNGLSGPPWNGCSRAIAPSTNPSPASAPRRARRWRCPCCSAGPCALAGPTSRSWPRISPW